MSRLTSRERLLRLLALIPWVASRGGATVEEIAERFDYPQAALLRDLQEIVFMVGVHPFTPDCLIEVDVDADRVVHIRYADWFSRPLALDTREAAALFTAGQAVAATLFDGDAGADDALRGPLVRALAKLAARVGPGAGEAVDIRLGAASEEILHALREAVEHRRRVRIEYFASSRSKLTERVIEPGRMFSSDGNWYAAAWCERAGGPRVFRADRIRSLELLDEEAHHPRVDGIDRAFTPDEGTPRVELVVDEGGGWVAEQYPVDRHEVDEVGHHHIRLAVADRPWLERLVLRLGEHLVAASGDEPYDDPLALGREAARRILERYADER